MGVHISFVRSTNLDTWQLAQLRNMKVGGNASAADFYRKHGGASLLNDADPRKKYSSKVAELYKEELAKRVKEDVNNFPDGIYVEGMETISDTPPKEDKEDDFFESWSKPSTPKPSAPASRVPTPPVDPPPAETAAPRTITSSAAARAAKLGSMSRLNSAASTSSTASTAKKSKLGLGASKAKPVDFAEAERKALEEAERIKQLGYDREREAAEEKARKEAEAAKAALEITRAAAAAPTNGVGSTANVSAAAVLEAQKSPTYARLGFGAIPGTGASSIAAASIVKPVASRAVADDAPTTAREKFGNQKAISSDMYFGRNSYDPNTVSEAKVRLQSFQGATSISSNQYFGRDEEEEQLATQNRSEGMLGDGSLAGLETAARDAMSRLMSNPEVQNVGESIRAGALKLSDYLAQMSER